MEAQGVKVINRQEMQEIIGLVREIMNDIAELTAKQKSLEAQIHYMWLEISGERLDTTLKN